MRRIAFALFLLSCLSFGFAEAKISYKIAPNGTIKELKLDNSLLLQNLKLAIIKPGWQGSYLDQDNTAAIREESKGTYSGEPSFDGRVVAFEEKIVPLKNGLEISYHLQPKSDIPIQGVIVFATLPASPNAGSGQWFALNTLADVLRKGNLPEKLPSPYVLLSGVYDEFGWTVQDGRHLRFELWGANSVQFQDDREFNSDTFELQIYAKTIESGMLRKGEKIDLKVRLSAMEKEEAEKNLEKIQKEIEKRKVVPMSSAKPLKVKKIEANAKQLKAYEKFELTLDLDATFDNPFDPNDISVFAYFITPGGKTIKVRGFYFQDYEMTPGGLKRRGEPVWKVRFAPAEEGTYRYYVVVKDRNGEVKSREDRFQVKGRDGEGFIRRSEKSPFYLRYDSGKSFFAIGENMCWGSL